MVVLTSFECAKCIKVPEFATGFPVIHRVSPFKHWERWEIDEKSQYKIPKLNLGFNRGHQMTHFEGNQTSSKSMVVLRDFPSKMKCMKFGARCHGVHGPRFIGVKINSSYPSIGIYSRPFIGVSYNCIFHWFLGPPCGETAFHHQELLNLNNAPAAGEPSDTKLSMRSYR